MYKMLNYENYFDMKNTLLILLGSFILFSTSVKAQLEKVIVETYYVSNDNDSTDITGGFLESGSKTYRVYVDLMKGSKLKKIFGDTNHALIIKSTAIFFNNIDRGESFGKDINKNYLDENTVALDTWLTIGQATKIGAMTYFGILKNQDTDGSFIGGINNDGGSASIPGGLLSNTSPEAEIPLTSADGLDTMSSVPTSWTDYGITVLGSDSTIFGSLKADSQFVSNNAGLLNSGTMGVIPDSNQVLVAQLTTKGELSFELNIEVEDSTGHITYYVANDSILLADEELNRYLKYPFEQVCGCPDPDYLEYLSDRDCDRTDSCKNRIIFGCMDTMACNYNPSANFNIQSLCCYPGLCNDRDLAFVCPELNNGRFNSPELNLSPNPAQNDVSFQISSKENTTVEYLLYNFQGEILLRESTGMPSGITTHTINVSKLPKGLYLIRVFVGNSSISRTFIKN